MAEWLYLLARFLIPWFLVMIAIWVYFDSKSPACRLLDTLWQLA